MTAQSVNVYFQTQSGKAISLEDQSVTDGTAQEITSGGSGLNLVAGVSLGQFAEGEVLTHGLGVFTDAGVYAFILDPNGKIIMPISISSDQGPCLVQPLCRPLRMVTGMTCQILSVDAGGASNPNTGAGFYCADGSVEYFTAQATNGSSVQFTSVQTGQSIGQTLSGKLIQKGFVNTSVLLDTAEVTGFQGIPILSSEGYTKAIYGPVYAVGNQTYPQVFPVRIMQNDTMQVTYDAS